MGNLCSCVAALDAHDPRTAALYEHSKYGPPMGQSGPVSHSIDKPSHSGSPRKHAQQRDAVTVALDQSELQPGSEEACGQAALQQQRPHGAAAEPQQQQQRHHHQHAQHAHHQAAAAAAAVAADGGGDQAAGEAQAGEPAEPPMPIVPFSWTKGELIGIGAFGRVFSALNNVTGELVAVKQVSFAKDEALQGRVAEHIRALEAEVEVLKNLQHDNIVRYLGTEKTDDSLHIFLEFVPGGSIASLLAKFGPFPESVIRVYTAQLLRGLEYLHQRGIMHRDIKGANILIDKAGTVKLADFGASKKIEDLATVGSGSKSIRGTPYWMAPEVIKQTGHGRPADIWSLACTVIEMATGKPPWSTYTAPVAAMFQIASSKDPPPLPEHLSREAKDFLLLCFNRVARERANATRLLKHPFVAGVTTSAQLQQPLPVPSPSSAVNSGGSPIGRTTPAGATGGRSQAPPPQPQPPHTPLGARQSSAQQTPGSCRQPQLGAGVGQGTMVKAMQAARSSPTGAARGSPRHQPVHGNQVASRGGACASPVPAPGSLAQRGDASALVTLQQHRAQQQAQQPGEPPVIKQQQSPSPRPSGVYRSPQPQAQHKQQQPPQAQQQQQQQQQQCMTLVDWNPMIEPSWAPGAYAAPAAASRQQHGRPQGSSNGGARPPPANQQQQQPGAADGLGPPLQPQPGSSTPGQLKRTPGAGGSSAGGSILAGGPGVKHRPSRQMDAPPGSSSLTSLGGSGSAAGPLAKGPAGRASRDSIAAAAAAGAGSSLLATAASIGGSGASRLTSRARGSSAAAAASGPSSGAASSSASGGSPGRSGCTSTATDAADADADGPSSKAGPAAAATGVEGGAQQAPQQQRLAASGSLSGLRQSSSAGSGSSGGMDVAMSMKRAQWESELYEELERHRKEQRATRAAGQAGRRSALAAAAQ